MSRILLAALATVALAPSAAMAAPDHDPRGYERTVIIQHDRTPDFRHSPRSREVSVRRIAVGARLEPAYLATSDRIAHPARYRLDRPRAHQRWIKVRDNAVLVNMRSGRIVAVHYDFFR
jgi:Ni/Co efflux regulator RcnB